MKKFLLITAILLCANMVWGAGAQLYKLDNGQTVIIQEVKNNPIVTIDTWIKTGSIDEDDSNNGVAHFLEHLFFKGTKNHAPGEFDKILETKGAITNAATSKDFTHYYITIPSKDFDLAMELHADMLMNPMIPRNEMEKERKVVLEEINKDSNSPQKKLYESIDSMLYTSHPYKRRVIGKSNIIETITRDKVLEFYNEHYSPSNMVTLVVGDVDTNYALNKIKEVFNGNIKKTEKKIYPKEQQLTEQKKQVEYIDTQSGYMLIGFRSTPITDKDSYAMDVLSTILGEGRSSVLYQVLKDKKRLAFSVGAGNMTYKDDGIFYVSANFEPDKCKSVQDTIFDEIKKIQNKGVSDEQLSLAKNIIERTTYYSRESVSNISNEIGYTVALTGDIKFYDNYLQNIKNISADDVKRVANKYLGINRSAVSILLPEDKKNVPVANKKYENNDAKLISENSQTQKYRLSNGATVLYTKNDFNDIIAVSINVKGGQLMENKAGVAVVTGASLLKGTKNYSPVELSQLLEDNGIKIVPSVNADIFSISVLTTKDQYEKTIELLDEIINNPSFDEVEIGKIKSDNLNQIRANKDVPLKVALEKYRELIFQNSPYTISANVLEKSLPNITREDIVNYYNNIMAPCNIDISVNGNVDKDELIKDLSNIFSRFENTKSFDYSQYAKVISKPNAPRISSQKMPATETAWIMLGWQTDGITNEKDYAALQIIDSILGGGMSSRMFKDLREKEGLAYQLGSGLSPHVLRGSFVLYIGTNPDTLDKAKKGL
ncbi:insulinase family protein, partial [bacterium]|nr:insulinase family protein [bacterium]